MAVHHLLRKSGDLIVFSRDGLRPNHVGIVVDEGTYIHAPGHDDTYVTMADIETTEIDGALDEPDALYCLNPIGYKAPSIAVTQPTYRIHQRPI